MQPNRHHTRPRGARRLAVDVATAFLVLTMGCAFGRVQHRSDALAPLLDGLGDHHVAVTTDDALAQRFFDQGIALTYGFNHAEALRSFREVVRRDPGCAMGYWGIAFVLGPNLNLPMEPDAVPEAWEASRRALELAPGASERERGFIEALAARYAPEPASDRTALDRAYADAMVRLAAQRPDDTDAQCLAADALMNLMPWDYWTDGGEPRAETRDVLARLERVIEMDPDHPGALHLYIHAVEAVRPELGVAAADRLGDLLPGAGHLVHMPSHIYIRVGRYHDATVANQEAVATDQDYITACNRQGVYALAYAPHNYHFLWATATLEGRYEVAVDAAREMAAGIDPEMMRAPGLSTLQHYWITPLYAYVRFGRWDEILATPEPDEDLVYPRAVRHYARGVALARTGEPATAAGELRALRTLAEDPRMDDVTVWDINAAGDLVAIAIETLAGEIDAAEGRSSDAVMHLRVAAAFEDELNYDEPPPWHQPVRQVLGDVLLASGRPEDAEAAYLEDLETFPENGWSLRGLQRSLEAQGREEDAAGVATRFENAWKYADTAIDASRF